MNNKYHADQILQQQFRLRWQCSYEHDCKNAGIVQTGLCCKQVGHLKLMSILENIFFAQV